MKLTRLVTNSAPLAQYLREQVVPIIPNFCAYLRSSALEAGDCRRPLKRFPHDGKTMESVSEAYRAALAYFKPDTECGRIIEEHLDALSFPRR